MFQIAQIILLKVMTFKNIHFKKHSENHLRIINIKKGCFCKFYFAENNSTEVTTKLRFTCLKSTKETLLEKGVKCVQSQC